MDEVCALYVANTNARVAVCSCGWVGVVHPLRKYLDHKTKRFRYDVAAAEEAATIEWARHVKVTHLALAPPDPERSRAIVTHRGRFGHP